MPSDCSARLGPLQGITSRNREKATQGAESGQFKEPQRANETAADGAG